MLLSSCVSVSHQDLSPVDKNASFLKAPHTAEYQIEGVADLDFCAFLKISSPLEVVGNPYICQTEETDHDVDIVMWNNNFMPHSPNRSLRPSKTNTADYDAYVIFDRKQVDSNIFNWVGILTLGIFPLRESDETYVAVKIKNRLSGAERKYFFKNRQVRWYSIIPISMRYLFHPNLPEYETKESLFQEVSKQIFSDIQNGKL